MQLGAARACLWGGKVFTINFVCTPLTTTTGQQRGREQLQQQLKS